MLCEKVIGSIKDEKYKNYKVDYVNIEWHDAFKKIHKITTDDGIEVGIKLDDSILIRGLRDGDVIGTENDTAVVVNIKESMWLAVTVEDCHLVPKVCYEIGNRHATLISGSAHNEFITIYDEPMKHMLEHLGVKVETKMMKIDFDKRISASVNNHHH